MSTHSLVKLFSLCDALPTLYFLLITPQVKQTFTAFPPDAAGNLDYKNLVYVITHGEEKD